MISINFLSYVELVISLLLCTSCSETRLTETQFQDVHNEVSREDMDSMCRQLTPSAIACSKFKRNFNFGVVCGSLLAVPLSFTIYMECKKLWQRYIAG